jgi:nitroreductase
LNAKEVLLNRSSKRDFLDKPVPEEIINELIDTALSSPSASNTQPYKLAIATGETRDAIASELTSIFDTANTIKRSRSPFKLLRSWAKGVHPTYDIKPVMEYPGELMQRRINCGSQLYKQLGIARGDANSRDQQLRKNFEFFGAPVVMFLFINKELAVQSSLDAGIFLQSLMLSATDYGLGTCSQGALAIWTTPIKQRFNIDDNYKLICGLALGYPSDASINAFSPAKQDRSSLVFESKS